MIYPYYTNTSQMPVQKTTGSSSSHIPFAVGTAIAGGVIGNDALDGLHLIFLGLRSLLGIYARSVLFVLVVILSRRRANAQAGQQNETQARA